MNHSTIAVAALAVTLAAGCAANAPAPQAPEVATMTERSPGRVAATSVTTATAIVEHVDQRQRLVTLRMSDGRTTTLGVGPEVRNLAQVEKGDEVVVGYLEAVAIEVNKSGGELGVVAGEDALRAAPGEKPAGAVARTTKVTAKIVEIDRENDEVTLEGKEGNRVTIDIRDPRHYEAIAVGDLVDFTFTQAVAVSVEPTTPD
jgi:Cu/Ag efflux protein CusF